MDSDHIPYLSILCHELKSPVNSIISLVKLIEMNLKETKKEEIKNYLSLIICQALFMRNYISNAIELGKIQEGKEELILEEFDLMEIFHEIIEITKIFIGSKPIQLKTHLTCESFFMLSDPLKIRQILMNITSNSVKFTKEGYIFIGLEILKREILIKIQDTGIGIPKDKINNLFNPYCSLKSINEKFFESSGLGLYITRELINILKGSIEIESEFGKGTTVYISLPQRYKTE